MTDLYWPQDIAPATQSFAPLDSAQLFRSIFVNSVRTVKRPGRSMGCSITYVGLTGAMRHRMRAFSAQLGRGDRVWLPDFGTLRRGTFPTGELLANTTFATATSGWTSSNAELLLSGEGRLRLTRAGVAASRTVAASASASINAVRYLFRAGLIAGAGTPNYRLQLGSSSGGTELAVTSTLTAGGYSHLLAAATGSSIFASIADFNTAKAVGHFSLLDSPSLSRCMAVSGAGQSGAMVKAAGFHAAAEPALAAGDVVGIYTDRWELKRLTMDAIGNADGTGYLCFDPPLHATPADGAAVAVHCPMGRFVLTEDPNESTSAGHVTDLSFELIEDVT